MNRIATVLVASLLAACAAPTADESSDTTQADLISGRAGAVYTLSNDAASNEVIVLRRAANGSLQRAASYATTGKGSGDGLGSQGALAFSSDRHWLFAVNAGSNEVSVFAVQGEVLYLVDTVPTGGIRPISVTEHGGLVYVVHAADGQANITGFALRGNGTLAPIADSTRALSSASGAPVDIQFSPSGRALLVTEKASNKIDEFRMDPYTGTPASLTVHDSNGQTPFGFAITQRGQVVISEAFGGAAGASKLSSYQLGNSAGLSTISASVADGESAACWVVLAKNDRVAYTSNTASGTISSYALATDASLSLVSGVAADLGDGTKPTDMALSRNEKFLYVLDSGTHALSVLAVSADGSLSALPSFTGLPAAAAGLAAQ